jgi:hypothetical protein
MIVARDAVTADARPEGVVGVVVGVVIAEKTT